MVQNFNPLVSTFIQNSYFEHKNYLSKSTFFNSIQFLSEVKNKERKKKENVRPCSK